MDPLPLVAKDESSSIEDHGSGVAAPSPDEHHLRISLHQTSNLGGTDGDYDNEDDDGDDDISSRLAIFQQHQRRCLTVTRSTRDDIDQAAAMIRSYIAEISPAVAMVKETVGQHFMHLLHDLRKKQGTSCCSSSKEEQDEAFKTLSEVPPFSYLPRPQIKALVEQELHVVHYKEAEVIVQQGKRDDDVYILATGRVVMVKLPLPNVFNRNQQQEPEPTARSATTILKQDSFFIGESKAKFMGYLDAPAFFGEYETLFETTRHSQVLAGATAVKLYRLSSRFFESLVQQHAAFRLKLALGLRHNGIFSDIEGFVALVRRFVSQHVDLLNVDELLQSYRQMVPAIHANLNSPRLDVEGWTYAVRRLPDTVTSTYVYLLSNNIPMQFMHPNCLLTAMRVPTVARRRQAFALDHGKLLVVLRETFSDALDFLSLLCCHIHECAKLRQKLIRPTALNVIHNCLWAPVPPTNTVALVGHHKFVRQETVSVQDQQAALQQLPLTPREQQGLQALWPRDFLYRIWDILSLHENIQIRSDLSSSSSSMGEATDRWAESIRSAAMDLLSCRNKNDKDVCLHSQVTTHIISSNTTSVRNLISPYILKNKTKIYNWGREHHVDITSHDTLSESDKLCALCNAYMKHHPTAVLEQDEFDQDCFKTLRQTELTGIQVELIDLNGLEETYVKHDIEPDALLAPSFAPRYQLGQGWTKIKTANATHRPHRLLVNIDYAFGRQAEIVISALSLLFGGSLTSVGIMGKAGGLQGKRGDIIVADYLVHQEGDEQTLIDNTGVDREALRTESQRNVHSGGVLTVLGTLLQDTRLLHFYKKLYGCVSLEMEGSFYARELRRFKKAGLLSDQVNLRFLYYVSDTPLSTDQTETLSSDMSLAELIPPQYAVTRALLRPVLASQSLKI